MTLLKLLGLINSISMILTPFILMRRDRLFNKDTKAISHLGGLKRTARTFKLFLLITGLLEYIFVMVVIFTFGVTNFTFSIPILSVTLVSTLAAALLNTKEHPREHYIAAIFTFVSAGLGGFVMSLEYARLSNLSPLSIVVIIISSLLFSSLLMGRKHLTLPANKELIFIIILVLLNLAYTVALFS